MNMARPTGPYGGSWSAINGMPYGENGVIVALSIIGSIGLAVAMIGAAVALRGTYDLAWAPLVLMLLARRLWPCPKRRVLG